MKEISVEEFLANYSLIDKFPENCRSCPNYGKTWSCPPYSFNIKDIWNKYKTLRIYGVQIIFNEKLIQKKHTHDKCIKILNESINVEHLKLLEKLEDLAHNESNPLILAPAKCVLCKKCARMDNQKCRFPNRLYYSIESRGRRRYQGR